LWAIDRADTRSGLVIGGKGSGCHVCPIDDVVQKRALHERDIFTLICKGPDIGRTSRVTVSASASPFR
jgi:hypothetical protein